MKPAIFIFCTFLFASTGFAQLQGFTIAGNPESVNGATWAYQDTTNGIVYDLTGILFKPIGTNVFPGVIISHGGGGNANGYSKNIAKKMVGWGLVCIGVNLCHAGNVPIGSPGTSTNGGASLPNIHRNMKAWDILANLGYVDTNCIAAHGHSLGAMATGATVGTNPSKFSVASHTAGGVNDAGPQYIKTPQANGIIVPYYLHHGDADATVPLIHARKMDTLLTNNSVIHQLDIYPGYNHSQISMDDTMFARTKIWYGQYLCVNPTGTKESLPQTDILNLSLYPNPSFGFTSLEFTISAPSFASMAIFNLAGKKVLTLAEGFFSAGKHTAQFDASQLESAVYFASIKTNSIFGSVKFVVFK